MDTRKSIISVIDKHFDKYYIETGKRSEFTPYENEENVTIFSFFKKVYALLKDKKTFENELLSKTYIECIKDVIKTIRYIENSKIYKFKMEPDDSNGASDKAYALLDCVYTLYKRYVNRNYDKELLKEEQKIGYETFYDESIYISKGLIPTYNENESGSVEFNLKNNPYLIKINGDGTFNIWINGVINNYPDYQSFKNQILKMASTGELLYYYTTSRLHENEELNTTYYITFAFEDGFTVDANNEYEQDNGLLLELFQFVSKSFETKSNVLEEYLKKYFYKTLVEKYRTKEILDKETHLITSDITATNNFSVFPKIYETLSGKSGKIGNSNTIDYDYNFDSYIKIPFNKSILLPNGDIDFYIDKNYLTSGNLRLLKQYDKIDYDNDIKTKSFLYTNYYKNINVNQINNFKYTSYFDHPDDNGNLGTEEFGNGYNKQLAKYIKLYGNELKEEIIKQNFFAVTPKFTPNIDRFFTLFYLNNVKKLQKEYFYDDNKKSKIDISFDKDYMVLKIKTDVLPNEETDFGSGVLNIRKTQQKFFDNIVSELSQTNTTTKNSNFKSNEFSSLMDDREFTVISSSDTILAQTEFGYTNVAYDDTNSYFINVNFPKFKQTNLYKKNNELWLDCTNFSNYNDINAISQIRILLMNGNKNRFLFNIKRIEKEYVALDLNVLELDIKLPSDFGISYVSDEKLFISDSIYSPLTDYKNEIVYINNSSTESININKINEEDYEFEFVPTSNIEHSYLYGDEIVFEEEDASIKNLKNNDNLLIVSGEIIREKEYKVNKYFVLEKNIYSESKMSFNNSIECQILDFISTKGNPKRKELGYFVYNSDYDNKPSLYVKEKEKSFLKVKPNKFYIKVFNNVEIDSDKILAKNSILYCLNNRQKISIKNNLSEFRMPGKKNIYIKPFTVSVKKMKTPSYGYGLPKRPVFDYSEIEIGIKNKGFLFENVSYIKEKGEMKKTFRTDLNFGDFFANITDINLNDIEIEYDLRKDKFFIIFNNSHYRDKKYICNSNTVDYKDINFNRIEIPKNEIDKNSYLFKLLKDALSLNSSEKHNTIFNYQGMTLDVINKELNNIEFGESKKVEEKINDINFEQSVGFNDFEFTLINKNH